MRCVLMEGNDSINSMRLDGRKRDSPVSSISVMSLDGRKRNSPLSRIIRCVLMKGNAIRPFVMDTGDREISK